ncbi:SUMO1 sentrin specific peptidase 8 [Thoreauomyces humboldtii]|nr:SUMO1 sentrin specific peptidase 8 [Thoreauomyces humboldtii]
MSAPLENHHLSWKDVTLYPSDISSLGPGEWLTDAILEFHCQFLEDALPESDVLLMRPAMVALMMAYESDVRELDGVLPRVKGKEMIVMMVNDGSGKEGGGSHWSLLVYTAAGTSLHSYDSLHPCNERPMRLAARRLCDLLGIAEPLDVIPVEVPLQEGASECGEYACGITEGLVRAWAEGKQEPGTWEKEWIVQVREKMASRIEELKESSTST